MPSVYNLDNQNAATTLGGFFAVGKFKAGNLTFGATATTDVLTHGLGAAPDFVLLSRKATGVGLTWAASTTTLTATRDDSTATEVWSYIVGILG